MLSEPLRSVAPTVVNDPPVATATLVHFAFEVAPSKISMVRSVPTARSVLPTISALALLSGSVEVL